MKKTLLNLACIFFLALGISSCSKPCVDCSNCPEGTTLTDESGNGVASLEICEDDAASQLEYEQAIELIEALGCECK